MALYIDCLGCQMGDHKRHQRVLQHAPEGGVGGAICRCNGECQEDREGRLREFLGRMGFSAPTHEEARS